MDKSKYRLGWLRLSPLKVAICLLLLMVGLLLIFSGTLMRSLDVKHGGVPRPSGLPWLREASVAWNTPEAMKLEETAAIEVRVSLEPADEEEVGSRVSAPGAVSTGTAELGRVVLATLTSTAFDIESAGGARRQILQKADTVWNWTIKPRLAGAHTLILTLETEAADGNVANSFRRTIQIQAKEPPSQSDKALDFVSKNWKDLWVVLLAPLAAAAWTWWKRRKDRQKAKELAASLPTLPGSVGGSNPTDSGKS